jgi:hypothetical protein
MAGHWRCTSSNGSVSNRSYVVTDGAPAMSGAVGSATTRAAGGIRSSVNTPGGAATLGTARTVYGRQDGLDTGPFFERIVEHADHTLTAQSPEGATSAAASEVSSIRFGAFVTTPNVSEEAAVGGAGGRWAASASRFVATAKPLSLSYAVDSSGMRRVARLGTETLSDDRCTRSVASVSGGVCSNPNAPAAPLQAVQPAGGPQGAVQLRLVVDDRGIVVGEDVLSSSSPALTQAAIFAARDSRFTAAVANCRAVSTQHTFGVQFGADMRRASSNGRETNL